MFLVSAHQTYMNRRLLKQRLIDKRTFNDKQQIDITQNHSNNLSNLYKSTQLLLANSMPMKKLINSNHYMQQAEEEKSISNQRTRKYFANNGHKFLFNNT